MLHFIKEDEDAHKTLFFNNLVFLIKVVENKGDAK